VRGTENLPGKSAEHTKNAEAKGKVLGSQESGHGPGQIAGIAKIED
jgi:hypothetical protein